MSPSFVDRTLPSASLMLTVKLDGLEAARLIGLAPTEGPEQEVGGTPTACRLSWPATVAGGIIV